MYSGLRRLWDRSVMNSLHQSSLPKMLGRSCKFFVADILENLDQFAIKMQEVSDQRNMLVDVGEPEGNEMQKRASFHTLPR